MDGMQQLQLRTPISYFERVLWACKQFIYVPTKKVFACKRSTFLAKKDSPAFF
jgi:hypothetical protein